MQLWNLIQGDCRERLLDIESGTVQTCITSPPYWNLSNYGHGEQIGLEGSIEEYVDQMVTVFREVRRCLREDGTLWLNLGDSYVNRQLVGMPWRVALALQSDGWILRSDIIWHKPNPMPESTKNNSRGRLRDSVWEQHAGQAGGEQGSPHEWRRRELGEVDPRGREKSKVCLDDCAVQGARVCCDSFCGDDAGSRIAVHQGRKQAIRFGTRSVRRGWNRSSGGFKAQTKFNRD